MAEYIKQEWKDVIVDETGKVIEAGTIINKVRMEHIETGITQVNNSLSEVTDRGYNSENFMTSGDCNDFTSGHFIVDSSLVANPPLIGNTLWHIQSYANSTGKQILQVAADWGNILYFKRIKNGNIWTPWQEIATMDKVLPLTGGTLSGDVTISKNINPTISVKSSTKGGAALWKAADDTNEWGSYIQDIDGIGNLLRIILKASNALNDSTMIDYRGTIYRLYGEHNITVSQAAPTTTLPNGCMHNVY